MQVLTTAPSSPQVLIKGRDALLLKNGRPFKAVPRADSAWYTLAQQVTLVRLKGRAAHPLRRLQRPTVDKPKRPDLGHGRRKGA